MCSSAALAPRSEVNSSAAAMRRSLTPVRVVIPGQVYRRDTFDQSHSAVFEQIGELAAACRAACKPIDDKRGTIEYRTRVAGVLARPS